MDMDSTLAPGRAEFTFFSSKHRTFTKRLHGEHEISPNRFQRTVTWSMFSDHSAVKLEIINKNNNYITTVMFGNQEIYFQRTSGRNHNEN